MTTIIGFLLDETGSMESIKDDTIGGFNAYVGALKKDLKGKCRFTLIKFDSNGMRPMCKGAELSEVPELNEDNYRPGAATPLIDASLKIIEKTAKTIKNKKKDKVICVIQTDGLENASKHKFTDLTSAVKEKEKDGWKFVFIGANMDAFAQAQHGGFSRGSTMSYAGERSGETFVAMASNTVAVAAGEKSDMSWTKSQRKASGEDETLAKLKKTPA